MNTLPFPAVTAPWRRLLCRLAGSIALLVCVPALATETWPRLPDDAEIEALRQQFRNEYTQSIGPCAARCPAGDDVQAQVCRAQACAGRCQLGRELLESKVLEIETVKAHQPRDPKPVSSAFLFALTMVARTVDNCRGGQEDETEYAIWMLEWRESGWYWSGNRLGVDVRQQNPADRRQRDAEFASYFGPDRLLRGWPEAVAEGEPWRIRMYAQDEMRPLNLRIQVDQRAADGSYVAAPGVTVTLASVSRDGPEERLALHVDSPDCIGCETDEIMGRRLQRVPDWNRPLLLRTDAQGSARVELFLDFSALGLRGEPQPAAGLEIPLLLGVRTAAPGEGEKLRKEQRVNLQVPGIGVVESIRYESARTGPGGGREWPLAEYLDDPGTRDGERTLVRGERVRVLRANESEIGSPGAIVGRPLAAGHILQVGDAIRVNACDLDTRPLVDNLPHGYPDQVWVGVRFFDGLRGRFGVSAQVCSAGLNIGRSADASGFRSGGKRFLYWAAGKGVDAAIEWLFAPARVVNRAMDAAAWFSWATGREASYLVLNSAVMVESPVGGGLVLTTREGAPWLVGAGTGADGLAVPPGSTGMLVDDQAALGPTDEERAARADAWLAAIASDAPLAKTAAVDPAATDGYGPPLDLPPAPSPSESDSGWLRLIVGGCVLLVLLSLVASRARGRPAGEARAPAHPRKRGARTCPSCHAPVGASARFCGACGASLTG